jgi:adenosylhomocysteine nucleosidase
MIGIIGAMTEELNVILKEVKDLKEVKLKIKTFYTGKISEKEVVIVLAGIGKVNAGITTSILIENFDVTSVINIGVAGGQKGVLHKDVVISQEVLYHDVNVTYFSDKPHGQIPGSEPLFYADKSLLEKTISIMNKLDINYKVGKIASGDQFITKLESIKEVNAIYEDIYAVEMEAAAIAHACTLYNIPFIIYRSISDLIDNEKQHLDFYEFLEEASENATKVLKELIEVI